MAGAGMLTLSANLLCAAVRAKIGMLAGATVRLAVAGFPVGFFVGIYVVAKRFHDIWRPRWAPAEPEQRCKRDPNRSSCAREPT